MDKPILFVNGLYHDKRAWQPVINELDGIVDYRFDYPNQTREYTDEAFDSFENAADLTMDFASSNNIELDECVVVGFSAGSNLLRYLHCERDVDFKKMVLISPNVGEIKGFFEQAHDSFHHILNVAGPDAFAHASMYLNFAPQFFEKNKSISAMVAHQFKVLYEGHEKALKALLNAFISDPTLSTPPTKFRCETSFMFGGLDLQSPPVIRDRYISKCTNAKVKYVDDGGHSLVFECPSDVAGLIRAAID